MQLACPACGTRDVRISRPHGLVQYLKSFVGLAALRCRHCNTRWETSFWSDGSWKYAHCPRCYRQELTKWTAHYYRPPGWTRFLLRLGATPLRCPACRCNFATFKPQRGVFYWRHKVRANVSPAGPDAAAMMAEHTPPGEESGEQMP